MNRTSHSIWGIGPATWISSMPLCLLNPLTSESLFQPIQISKKAYEIGMPKRLQTELVTCGGYERFTGGR